MNRTIRLVVILAVVALSEAVPSAQGAATARVMREKLAHSQRILEAILSSNFQLLERESVALGKATESPAWSVLKGPEYLKQSEAFLKVLRELSTAAKDHDLDTAAERYTALTMTCFRCHRYMKDQRIADR